MKAFKSSICFNASQNFLNRFISLYCYVYIENAIFHIFSPLIFQLPNILSTVAQFSFQSLNFVFSRPLLYVMLSDLMLSRSTFMTSLLFILYRNDDHSYLINSNGNWKNDEQETPSWLCICGARPTRVPFTLFHIQYIGIFSNIYF